MTSLPPPDEFYAARDDRTNRISDGTDYRDARILVAGERDVLSTYAGRVAARTTLNLLSRFARNVDVAFPSVPADDELEPAAPTLAEQSIKQMRAADPHGRFRWTHSPAPSSYDCIVAVGNPDLEAGATPTIRLDGGDWLARVVRDRPVESVGSRDENPIGPAVAACLGGAEAFKTVVGASRAALTDAVTYDAFHHETHGVSAEPATPDLPSSIDLGTARMAGVGSVGSAATYFLKRLPVEGTLQLIDFDPVELVNLNRSPLFTASHALEGASKVEAAAEFLADHVDVRPFEGDYDGFTATDPEAADIVLPLANERNVRRSIQHDRPPLMVHASTGQSDVFVRRNIPLEEPCLLCHFPPDTAKTDAACAAGKAPADDEAEEGGPDAAFPFASFLAGCFVAGELAKLPLDGYPFVEPIALVRTLTDLGGVGAVMQYTPSGDDECPFCPKVYPEVHRAAIERTRFAHLTGVEH
ncbi:ThiF family adenylyltransferase [Halopenitus persicus]|uniref:ThiF family protein n=1 Tax=Halopenitus persicus TaxID=1048396 RepID=A0A1H3LE49_9EURY|nr:ThiF family adenylyltransferase [Halopenitus persicus]SDY62661.1 ThiF family protein [Halopenitus persicus]